MGFLIISCHFGSARFQKSPSPTPFSPVPPLADPKPAVLSRVACGFGSSTLDKSRQHTAGCLPLSPAVSGCSPRNVATGANPRSGMKRSSWKVAAIGESCTKPEPKSLAYRIRLLLQERVPPNAFLFGGPKTILRLCKSII